jgi:hypothetical protein
MIDIVLKHDTHVCIFRQLSLEARLQRRSIRLWCDIVAVHSKKKHPYNTRIYGRLFLLVVSRKATPFGGGSHHEQEAASLYGLHFGKLRFWCWKWLSESLFIWRKRGPLRCRERATGMSSNNVSKATSRYLIVTCCLVITPWNANKLPSAELSNKVSVRGLLGRLSRSGNPQLCPVISLCNRITRASITLTSQPPLPASILRPGLLA